MTKKSSSQNTTPLGHLYHKARIRHLIIALGYLILLAFLIAGGLIINDTSRKATRTPSKAAGCNVDTEIECGDMCCNRQTEVCKSIANTKACFPKDPPQNNDCECNCYQKPPCPTGFKCVNKKCVLKSTPKPNGSPSPTSGPSSNPIPTTATPAGGGQPSPKNTKTPTNAPIPTGGGNYGLGG